MKITISLFHFFDDIDHSTSTNVYPLEIDVVASDQGHVASSPTDVPS